MGLLITLALAALVTSALSAVLGMGGGALLLAVMLTALPWAEVIPLPAVVQLASNGTRVLAYLPQVSWPVVTRFAAGLLPGGLLGALLLGELGLGVGVLDDADACVELRDVAVDLGAADADGPLAVPLGVDPADRARVAAAVEALEA